MTKVGERLIAAARDARLHFRAAIGKGDWLEDAEHENGNYNCVCCHCGEIFIGHKRRVCCRICADVAK